MKNSYLKHTVGKRKTSIARVYLKEGSGTITINKTPLNDYLLRPTSRKLVTQALELTDTLEKYDIKINVVGGGLSGQAGAIRHGIARTLEKINTEMRSPLKKAGMLTRDSREVERKKCGQPGARKRFQFSKR